jgi:hypothetical protein
VLISGLESTACPFCWIANVLTSCWKNYILQQGSTNPRPSTWYHNWYAVFSEIIFFFINM